MANADKADRIKTLKQKLFISFHRETLGWSHELWVSVDENGVAWWKHRLGSYALVIIRSLFFLCSIVIRSRQFRY